MVQAGVLIILDHHSCLSGCSGQTKNVCRASATFEIRQRCLEYRL